MVREQAKKDIGLHRVQTMLGRHRMLPGYGKGKSSREEARASRAAINTPIQGSAADVVAAAMVRIYQDPFFRRLGWRMLLQVHDEVCTLPGTRCGASGQGFSAVAAAWLQWRRIALFRAGHCSSSTYSSACLLMVWPTSRRWHMRHGRAVLCR